jgi:hypothetical protein
MTITQSTITPSAPATAIDRTVIQSSLFLRYVSRVGRAPK